MKVLIAPSQFGEKPLRRLSEHGFEPVPNPFRRKLTREEVVELLQGKPGIIAGLEPLDRDVLGKTRLKVISRCGSGMSNVDIDEAERLGIKVFSTPNGPTTAVAEATLAALLTLLRDFPAASALVHAGTWQKSTGFQLAGKTAAVIGFGRIGREVARLLQAFRVDVLAVDPFLPEGSLGPIRVATLEEALPRADIFCLHANADRLLLGREQFARMKQGVYVLNASRGEALDEDALMEALEGKRVAGTWLDVYSHEPYRGGLTRYPQALLTPHIASYTHEGREIMEMEAVDNLLKGFRNA